MSPTQMDIMRLGLEGDALLAAKEIAKSHPDVVFTSGRRMRADQARAMASNILASAHGWIRNTYKKSEASEACASWVDVYLRDELDSISGGLFDVMSKLTDEQLSKLSKHMSGHAFDIQPVYGLRGSMILSTAKKVVAKYGGKFIQHEGGLERWHCQF